MVVRWVFTDPYTNPNEVWTVPINPNRMTSPFGEKSVTTRATTAVNGKKLLSEGNMPPVAWQFGGAILDHAHYAELLRWVKKRNRTLVRDHFGREMTVYLVSFQPEPKRARNRYWRHDYTINALVLTEPTAPTVGI